MGLSKSKSSFCLIRRLWVAFTPEEAVRQNLIKQMIGPLGFPRGHLAVERDLFSLHSAGVIGRDFPLTHLNAGRRIDLVCFYLAQKGELRPLLLIECKAEALNFEAENQLFGYNAQIGAPFVCLASGSETKMLWQENGVVKSIPFLPSYAQLIEKVC